MAELKTRPNEASIEAFLETVPDEQRRQDCTTVMELMRKLSKSEAQMWGESIIGFGTYRLRYPNGREIDWMLVGLSPRKQNLTLYFRHYLETYGPLLDGLGKYKTGKGCLYIKKLEDIDLGVLEKLIAASIKD